MGRSCAAFQPKTQKSRSDPSHPQSIPIQKNKARRIPAKGQEQFNGPERFFAMASRDPDMCAYGPEHVHQALKMYAVEELMIANNGSPGGLDTHAWATLAANHKVPVISIVERDSLAGKRFCNGVGVGALLWRQMEFTTDSPMWSHAKCTANSHNDAFCLETGTEDLPPQTVPEPPLSRFASDQSLLLGCPHEDFFLWLRRALLDEVDACTASAFWDGVYVILTDDLSCEWELQEALVNAQDVLAAEAPKCSLELCDAWCATHLDQDMILQPCFMDQDMAAESTCTADLSGPGADHVEGHDTAAVCPRSDVSDDNVSETSAEDSAALVTTALVGDGSYASQIIPQAHVAPGHAGAPHAEVGSAGHGCVMEVEAHAAGALALIMLVGKHLTIDFLSQACIWALAYLRFGRQMQFAPTRPLPPPEPPPSLC